MLRCGVLKLCHRYTPFARQDYKEICLMIAWLGSLIGFAFHNSSFFPMEIDSAPRLCNRVHTVLELPSANALRLSELAC